METKWPLTVLQTDGTVIIDVLDLADVRIGQAVAVESRDGNHWEGYVVEVLSPSRVRVFGREMLLEPWRK